MATWIAQMAQALVEIPSVTLQEAEVCRFYAAQLDELGFTVDRREVSAGRYNLYARLPGSGNGPSLMLNGHLDTIPVGGCVPLPPRGGPPLRTRVDRHEGGRWRPCSARCGR